MVYSQHLFSFSIIKNDNIGFGEPNKIIEGVDNEVRYHACPGLNGSS